MPFSARRQPSAATAGLHVDSPSVLDMCMTQPRSGACSNATTEWRAWEGTSREILRVSTASAMRGSGNAPPLQAPHTKPRRLTTVVTGAAPSSPPQRYPRFSTLWFRSRRRRLRQRTSPPKSVYNHCEPQCDSYPEPARIVIMKFENQKIQTESHPHHNYEL